MAIIKITMRSEHDYPYVKPMIQKYFGPYSHLGMELGDTNVYKLNIDQFAEDEEVFIHQMHYSPATNTASLRIGNRNAIIEAS